MGAKLVFTVELDETPTMDSLDGLRSDLESCVNDKSLEDANGDNVDTTSVDLKLTVMQEMTVDVP